ncbi:hypothetical protein ScPMuIL_016308 [Solemya velum]
MWKQFTPKPGKDKPQTHKSEERIFLPQISNKTKPARPSSRGQTFRDKQVSNLLKPHAPNLQPQSSWRREIGELPAAPKSPLYDDIYDFGSESAEEYLLSQGIRRTKPYAPGEQKPKRQLKNWEVFRRRKQIEAGQMKEDPDLYNFDGLTLDEYMIPAPKRTKPYAPGEKKVKRQPTNWEVFRQRKLAETRGVQEKEDPDLYNFDGITCDDELPGPRRTKPYAPGEKKVKRQPTNWEVFRQRKLAETRGVQEKEDPDLYNFDGITCDDELPGRQRRGRFGVVEDRTCVLVRRRPLAYRQMENYGREPKWLEAAREREMAAASSSHEDPDLYDPEKLKDYVGLFEHPKPRRY